MNDINLEHNRLFKSNAGFSGNTEWRCSVLRESPTTALAYAYDVENRISYIAEWAVEPSTNLQEIADRVATGNAFDENVWVSDDPAHENPDNLTWAQASYLWARVATFGHR